MFKVITFYEYINLEDPFYWKNKFKWICSELKLKGRILLGEEGINAGVCGSQNNIEEFKTKIKTHFPTLTFREQDAKEQVYRKLIIRIRDEIVKFKEKTDLNNKGTYISPKTLKSMLDRKEDLVLLDARNNYEFKVGRFKDAIDLDIKNFYNFPQKIEEIKDLKDKKIVMYCTGGIRCEKSSAFLKEQGFKDVNHLQGGIINFINQFPNTYFEGGLFVFDDRLVSNSGKIITNCKHCNKEEDQYQNCHNLDCDKLFICCNDCGSKTRWTCSEKCKGSERQRKKMAVNTS